MARRAASGGYRLPANVRLISSDLIWRTPLRWDVLACTARLYLPSHLGSCTGAKGTALCTAVRRLSTIAVPDRENLA